jgi:hypothetical protein
MNMKGLFLGSLAAGADAFVGKGELAGRLPAVLSAVAAENLSCSNGL